MKSNAHLDEEQLLRYADGELPVKQARAAREHIEACWQCRTAYDELQSLVAECVRYRKNVLHHFLPSPPARWGDIYEGFARIDASQERIPHIFQFLKSLRPALPWAPAFAVLAGLVLLVPLLRDTSSVQAAELLRKAESAAATRPSVVRRIRVRTAKADFVRRVGIPSEVMAPLFRSAKYDWEDPLSAKAFANWRETLTDKKDEVTSDAQSVRVRTSTSTGELAEATLTMRAQDLQPVQERLEFRNREWVEISDLGAETVPAASEPVSTAAAPKAETDPPHLGEPQATKADELRVLAALHGIGADLGDPIEVSPAGSKVEVSGLGIAPQRQQQIRETLRPLPGVVVRFAEPSTAAAAPTIESAPVTSATALPGQFQSALEKQAGGRQRFEQFSGQVLDLNETMMSRAYALRKLAERFPASVEAELNAQDRAVLQRMNREHAAALAECVAQMQAKLSVVLTPMGAKARGVTAPQAANWQAGAEVLFVSARRTEGLLAALLGVTPDAGENPRLPADVLTSLAELRVGAAAYDKLALETPFSK